MQRSHSSRDCHPPSEIKVNNEADFLTVLNPGHLVSEGSFGPGLGQFFCQFRIWIVFVEMRDFVKTRPGLIFHISGDNKMSNHKGQMPWNLHIYFTSNRYKSKENQINQNCRFSSSDFFLICLMNEFEKKTTWCPSRLKDIHQSRVVLGRLRRRLG